MLKIKTIVCHICPISMYICMCVCRYFISQMQQMDNDGSIMLTMCYVINIYCCLTIFLFLPSIFLSFCISLIFGFEPFFFWFVLGGFLSTFSFDQFDFCILSLHIDLIFCFFFLGFIPHHIHLLTARFLLKTHIFLLLIFCHLKKLVETS